MKYLLAMVIGFFIVLLNLAVEWIARKTGLDFYFVLFVAWTLMFIAVDSQD